MTAVGIDLSLTATGVMHVDGTGALIGREGITNLSIAAQQSALNEIGADIVLAVRAVSRARETPAAVAIEQLDMAQSYGGQIERTVLWWKVVETLNDLDITVLVVPSPQLKMYATGKGAGGKDVVVDAVARRWPHFETRGNNNLADAAVLAAIASHMIGYPLTPDLPATHTRALDKVRSIDVAPPVKTRKKPA